MNFSHLLVPVDFSAPSVRALRLAVKLARHGRARITVVHVVAPPVAPLAADISGWAALDTDLMIRYQAEIEGNAAHQLRRVAGEEIPEDVTWSTLVRPGTIEEVILEATKEIGADLIVIGTVGRTGLPHLLLGSVTERVVARASVPVLVTH